jgi:hypothetical protein
MERIVVVVAESEKFNVASLRDQTITDASPELPGRLAGRRALVQISITLMETYRAKVFQCRLPQQTLLGHFQPGAGHSEITAVQAWVFSDICE